MINDRKIKSQDKFPFKKDDSGTITNTSFRGRDIKSVGENNEVYRAITTINNRLNAIEKENAQLRKELRDTKKRENKLLNRFSWLIQIINIGSVILIIMAIILFIDSFYPFIKKLIDNSIGATIVVGAIGSTISGGIIALWLKFNKYVKEVIDRERKL